jgi:hypothetical protein
MKTDFFDNIGQKTASHQYAVLFFQPLPSGMSWVLPKDIHSTPEKIHGQ